ncbi:aspartate/glutamate racemase family protein [Nonomuraea gerenzanensis]|uniref:Aspartate racemase n=1 Tax=Nonomuraea gerenzanensis TaxID=93944 RepID=A0A1M4DVT7_9ACTN|nr:aspartate/glutamate racemase family protein [Nonomuraea gerenzanensis]UBU13039.1 aspartate/glutamate racemase family protein [Nonomuraea gerenzanensis]SBO90681.1 Aspartate racemase [Nonomuraea gerenzanensis]
MRTIGLIGGLSWESTVIYYQIINQRIREELGGSHSANSLIWSVDYTTVEDLIFADQWDDVAKLLADAGAKLEHMGAELLLICSNTFNRVCDEVAQNTGVPVLHIADAVGAEVVSRGWRKVGLLGTRFTMEEPFLRDRLAAYGFEVVVPGRDRRELVHRIIFDELVRGVLRPSSKAAYVDIVAELAAEGAEGVILGCTEIELLISDGDTAVPVLPSARLHAEAAARLALEG